jgi:nucleotide-binding universal stress UspA family protein
MFKHLLLPTDGSPVSAKAVKAGIALARRLGARVTGYYALEGVPPPVFAEGYIPDPKTISMWDRSMMEFGTKQIAAMEKLARAARVRFEGVCARAATPADGIVRTARRKRCDAIFMASHGRSGIAKLVMGSVTDRVIRTSSVPVVIYR